MTIVVEAKKWGVRLAASAGALATTRYYQHARRRIPEHRYGEVRIYGDMMYVSGIAQALSQLSAEYPYGYSLVQRYIRGVVQGESRRGKGIFLGVVYREWRRRNELPFPPNRVAAQLVRQAVKMRKLLGFSIWRSSRSELGSFYWEAKAMKRLKCDSMYFAAVEAEIAKHNRHLQRRIPGAAKIKSAYIFRRLLEISLNEPAALPVDAQ